MTDAASSFAAGVVLAGLFAALLVSDPPHYALPDDTATPGLAASSDEREVCGRDGGLTYSRRHRQTTAAMKDEVARAYGHAGDRSEHEIDHRLPLALGGADDVKNLWWQPAPDFHKKDRLEVRVWEMVCHTHEMLLLDAQRLFLAPARWPDSYRQVFGQEP